MESEIAESQTELKTILAQKGEATVYFVAVDCQKKVGRREQRKIEKWVITEFLNPIQPQAVIVDSKYYISGTEKAPAVKARITTEAQFIETFKSLAELTNSSCGCSLMINDGQGTDVRVMNVGYVTGGERKIL